MAAQVHPAAHVEKGAELADGVVVGPGAYVGSQVKVGKGTIIEAHAHLAGATEIGEGNHIFPFASVGTRPQDLKYKGEPTRLIVGNRNQIREFTTLNIGTVQGGGVTKIGDECLFMAYTHVAHDCHIGNRVVMTNNALLAGHVTLQDWVILGGTAKINQFTRIGAHAIVSAEAGITRDVPPFCIAAGRYGELFGLNVIGLRRRGFDSETRRTLKRAYRVAFRGELKLPQAVEALRREFGGSIPGAKEVQQLVEFLATATRPVCLDASKRRKLKRQQGSGSAPEGAEETED